MAEKVPCPECKWAYTVNKDGSLRKHKRTDGAICGQLSDPAPTVDETTTQGDDVAEKGPWFGAMYGGKCSVNECLIAEGDRIRADGAGGYECEDCGDFDDTMDRHVRASLGVTEDVANAYGSMGGADLMDPAPVTADEFLSVGNRPPSQGVLTMTADEFLDPADTQAVEPVMGVNGQPKKVRRDHMKRYAVVLPGETELETYRSSGKPVGRTRATTFNKAATDKKNINDWGKRNVVIGASRRRDLLLKAQGLTHENDRDRLNAIVVELEEAAGAKVGSDLGTYLHEFTEYIDAGLKTWEDAPAEFQESLRRYTQVLKDAGLIPVTWLIERTTIIREFGWVCGTFDRIFYHEPSGQYVIGDLKTGKTMDYGKNEIECQLWTYAHGVNQNGIYDWNTDTWQPHFLADVTNGPTGGSHKVSETVGVVIHMPVQGPQEGTVSLLWADLEAGAAHARLCDAVRSQPKGKMRPWGDGPARTAPLSWGMRFAAVTSGEEASALWVEAKNAGVHPMTLQDLVRVAQDVLAGKG